MVFFAGGAYKIKSFDRYGFGPNSPAATFRRLADQYNASLYIHSAFWHQDVNAQLQNASKDQVISYMQERVKKLLAFVNKGAKQPTYINFLNEALWAYGGKTGWENSPYYKAFGEKLIVESYLMFYRTAKEMGLEPGKDFKLIYSDYFLHTNNPKSNLVYNELIKAKAEIANRLNIPVDQVPLDVAMQLRLDVNNHSAQDSTQGGRRPVPSDEELLERIKLFSQIGRVSLTELHVINATPQERQNIINRIVALSAKSGLVDNIIFEATFRFPDVTIDDTSSEYVGLFNRDYSPTSGYYSLLNILFAQK